MLLLLLYVTCKLLQGHLIRHVIINVVSQNIAYTQVFYKEPTPILCRSSCHGGVKHIRMLLHIMLQHTLPYFSLFVLRFIIQP